MKEENILEAFKHLDKFTQNDFAIREVRKIKEKDLNVEIAQEGFYDSLVNFFDKKRVILEKKADILNKLYGDSKLAADLTMDYLEESRYINNAKFAGILGLIGYNGYTFFTKKAPLLKLPGLGISILSIHAITRQYTNSILEKKLERPWKIHSYRVSKGLGPTNTKDNPHNEYFNLWREVSKFLSSDNPEDYLFQNDEIEEEFSIYRKIFKPKKLRPFNLAHYDFELVVPDYRLTRESAKYMKEDEKEGSHTIQELKEAAANNSHPKRQTKDDIYLQTLKHNFVHNGIQIDSREELRPTFEAKHAEEVSLSDDVINLRNEYTDSILLADGNSNEPEYKRLINLVTFVPEFKKKYYFDWEINKDLADLKKKVHFLRKFGAEESQIISTIAEFNDYAERKISEFNQKKILAEGASSDQSVLVQNASDINHLREFFNFVNSNKINLLKSKEEPAPEFDFDVNPIGYNPWDEYKQTYNDLFTKGRKYFIIQSIPDWKFLQVRKPTPRRLDDIPEKKNLMDVKLYRTRADSVFDLLSLERYHRERYRKENVHHQEFNVTHRV